MSWVTTIFAPKKLLLVEQLLIYEVLFSAILLWKLDLAKKFCFWSFPARKLKLIDIHYPSSSSY